VGVRCYTYISTLHYVMKACAENHVPLIVLDRPNPLGFYVDGPVLDTAFRSFVGIHPIPLVYGLTVGELALMINGEGWLAKGLHCDLGVIPCGNYTHKSRYQLPVNPSPNLQNMEAVYLYPSIALFEGTIMNVGRGTPFSYQVFGHPEYPVHDFSYTPVASSSNVSPKHMDRLCYGINLQHIPVDTLYQTDRINLSWLIDAYETMNRSDFFIPFIDKLAGTDSLRKQVKAGWSEEQIRESWKPQLEKYKQMRKKYLLYPVDDFYADWVNSELGNNDTSLARIFTKLDGKGIELREGYKGDAPLVASDWILGPGALMVNRDILRMIVSIKSKLKPVLKRYFTLSLPVN